MEVEVRTVFAGIRTTVRLAPGDTVRALRLRAQAQLQLAGGIKLLCRVRGGFQELVLTLSSDIMSAYGPAQLRGVYAAGCPPKRSTLCGRARHRTWRVFGASVCTLEIHRNQILPNFKNSLCR